MPEIHTSEGARPPSFLRGIPGWGLVAIAFLGFSGCLVVGLGVLVAIAPTPNPGTSTAIGSQTMPDGTILVLEQVTSGMRHRFHHEWRQPAQPFDWLFGDATAKFVEDESTIEDRQMLWFTRRDAQTGQPLDFDWWERCIAIDDQGWEIEDDEHSCGRDAHTASGSSGYEGSRPFSPLPSEQYRAIVAHCALPRFRCSAPTFKLKVLGRGRAVVAEFDVPATSLGVIPQWTPEPIPVTKTDRDLSVTLTGLAARPRAPVEGQRVARREIALEPQFEVRWKGELTSSWGSREMTLSDALGNQSSAWDCRLNPFEAAWKLNIRLYRSDLAALDPSEQLIVDNIELPAPGNVRALGQSLTVGPVSLELTAVGNGKVIYTESAPQRSSGGGGSSSEGTIGEKSHRYKIVQADKEGLRTMTVDATIPHVRYRLSGVDQNQRFQLRVVNNEGKELFGSTSTFDNAVVLLLPELAGAESFKVVATIQSVREFEFVVAPPEEFRAASTREREPSH